MMTQWNNPEPSVSPDSVLGRLSYLSEFQFPHPKGKGIVTTDNKGVYLPTIGFNINTKQRGKDFILRLPGSRGQVRRSKHVYYLL